MRVLRQLILLVWLALLPALAAAAPPKPLFAASDVIRLTIKGPLSTLATSGRNSAVPVAGTLTIQGAAPETLPIALTTRGVTRRASDICRFPPLRVEFTEKPAPTSLFRGQKKLKLVTHCQPSESFQHYLLTEYAAYRMYDLLTPLSFDVRLALIDYVDASGKAMTTRMGFFIEDTDDVAKRNGLHEAKTGDRIPVATLGPADAGRFAVFQYLIGNLDWAMNGGPVGTGCCHNAKLIAPEGAASGFVPVPYDFDFAGMVDAPYATPPAILAAELPNVRVRRYRGFCRHNAEAQAAAASIVAHRADMLAVLERIPELGTDGRKARAYLDTGFDQLASPDGMARMLKACL